MTPRRKANHNSHSHHPLAYSLGGDTTTMYRIATLNCRSRDTIFASPVDNSGVFRSGTQQISVFALRKSESRSDRRVAALSFQQHGNSYQQSAQQRGDRNCNHCFHSFVPLRSGVPVPCVQFPPPIRLMSRSNPPTIWSKRRSPASPECSGPTTQRRTSLRLQAAPCARPSAISAANGNGRVMRSRPSSARSSGATRCGM
jgi:hypothetical protein